MSEKKTEISVEQLIAKYKEVYTISGVDSEGKELVGHYRKPDYETRKQIFAIAYKDQSNLVGIGELILSKCFVGGDNLWLNEDVKFEATVKAAEMIEFNDTLTIKKNLPTTK